MRGRARGHRARDITGPARSSTSPFTDVLARELCYWCSSGGMDPCGNASYTFNVYYQAQEQ
ncbi:hypothetical protein E2562_036445, partial [Oryza meyeriana var. granulata]